MHIAVVGTGVAGLAAAHHLHRSHRITVFEAGPRPGGHANTVRVTLDDGEHDVDTGFIVYNEDNYPRFTRLLRDLGVTTQASDMSFSVSDERTGLEYAGTDLGTLFAQPSSLLRPRFHRMLADIVRFNRLGRRLAADPADRRTLGDVLRAGRWSDAFVEQYLVPLGSAIWSADPATFERFPAHHLARFLDHHGLLRLGGRPTWRTVTGGSRRYVERIVAPWRDRLHVSTPIETILRHHDHVEIRTADDVARFDHVVVATHSDQALRLLGDPTPAEREVLGSLRYQPNVATLHTDERFLPRARRAWASWNYHRTLEPRGTVTVTYHMNRLQRLESRHQLLVTLNRHDEVDPARVLGRFEYSHPVYDPGAFAAQRRKAEVDGVARTWFCGAYWGYGFHEDGLRSGEEVAAALDTTVPLAAAA